MLRVVVDSLPVPLRRDDVGHLSPGARADLMLIDTPSHAHLAYRPGVPLVSAVYAGGDPA